MTNGPKLNKENLREFVLRSTQKHRFLQETPILPDVWVALAEAAIDGTYADLLIVPHNKSSAAAVADVLLKNLNLKDRVRAKIAFLRSEVAAFLNFSEVFRLLLPMSGLWRDYIEMSPGSAGSVGDEMLAKAHRAVHADPPETKTLQAMIGENDRAPLWRLLILAGLVGYLADAGTKRDADMRVEKVNALLGKLLEGTAIPSDVKMLLPPLKSLWEERLKPEYFKQRKSQDIARGSVDAMEATIWTINRNRTVDTAMYKARRTVKADAVERLFNTDSSGIVWAVIDTGIDARHPAFAKRNIDGEIPESSWSNAENRGQGIDPEESRVKATFDFSRIRAIHSTLLCGDTDGHALLRQAAKASGLTVKQAQELIDNAQVAVRNQNVVDWGALVPFLQISHRPKAYVPPAFSHGTHVAGILGGAWKKKADPEDKNVKHDLVETTEGEANTYKYELLGVAPHVCFYDLRIRGGDDEEAEEFAILAALQFISYLNRDRSVRAVHGVNLSLQVTNHVRNFACGQTPLCLECDRLVSEGTVVVAAAGNHGFKTLQTDGNGTFETHIPISIADPGNAALAITVGATHRESPHTYGVSYFSSRGPTGDGRLKPDILAPGERIFSSMPLSQDRPMADVLDGTSMAAPHVSGAAALLMARNPELIGRALRIKEILMATATDLGRDRQFQGAGLLDILRALQSI